MTTPKVAIIGAGNWGKHLVRNYAGLNALKLICDTNPDTLAQFGRQYPQVDTCLNLSDILARQDIQGIVISAPAEAHFRIAREALLSGKHVFVEKPLVLNEKNATELIHLAADQHLILMVGHLIQYHPSFVKLKHLVATGELGRINYIYSHRLNLGKIRREENILWSFAPHDISMILALAGEAPESVIAMGGNYLHKHIADVTTTHMEFASGLKAHIFVSWLHPFKEQKLVVVGDCKMAVFDDSQDWPDKLLLYPHVIKWENNIPTPAKREPERIVTTQEEPLNAECRHFLHCIQSGQNPLTDGQEGLRVQRVLQASQQSLENNSKVVYLKKPASGLPDSTHHLPYFVHETTCIDDGVKIGKGVRIWHFSHILKDCQLGENCNIGQNVVIGPDVTVGKGCKIQNNVSIYKGVTLEENVFCGPSMVFTNVLNPRADIRRMSEVRTTLVKKGATLGANCTILCGNTIGSHAFIGAGAVITHDVPDYALMTGNPARQVGWMCRCGNKLDKDFHCAACHLTIRELSMQQHL